MEKNEICNKANDNCPKQCFSRTPHNCDNTCGWEVRCGYVGSDSQFEIVKCVPAKEKEIENQCYTCDSWDSKNEIMPESCKKCEDYNNHSSRGLIIGRRGSDNGTS